MQNQSKLNSIKYGFLGEKGVLIAQRSIIGNAGSMTLREFVIINPLEETSWEK